MLLSKQPGDTGVFATATSARICIYALSHQALSEVIVDTGDDVAPASSRKARPQEALCDPRDGLEWDRRRARGSFAAAEGAPRGRSGEPPSPCGAADAFAMWGTPLRPLRAYAVDALLQQPRFPRLARAGGGGGASSAFLGRAAGPAFLPASLSLSPAGGGGAVHFFVSDQSGRGWVARSDAAGLSGLRVAADEKRDDEADKAAKAKHDEDEDEEEGEGGEDAMLSAPCVITASGWDPRNAGIVALGRQDAVVELLDVEYGMGGAEDPLSPGVGRFRAGLARGRGGGAFSVIRAHRAVGPVAAMDWVPQSHITVVAARRPDGLGFCAELLDLRSPGVGVRYLGAPPGMLGALGCARGGLRGGVPALGLCYGEHVACSPARGYVATTGPQNDRDILQLWDLRTCAVPLSQRVLGRVGYTSLCWSTEDPLTVIATTRAGGLCVHAFTEDAANERVSWRGHAEPSEGTAQDGNARISLPAARGVGGGVGSEEDAGAAPALRGAPARRRPPPRDARAAPTSFLPSDADRDRGASKFSDPNASLPVSDHALYNWGVWAEGGTMDDSDSDDLGGSLSFPQTTRATSVAGKVRGADSANFMSSLGVRQDYTAASGPARRGSLSSRKYHLPTRVPTAAVGWLTPGSVRGRSGAPGAARLSRLHKGGRLIQPGCCMDLPRLLLLNSENGELYTQVFNRKGTVVSMMGEVPFAAAGPNLFVVEYIERFHHIELLRQERRLCFLTHHVQAMTVGLTRGLASLWPIELPVSESLQKGVGGEAACGTTKSHPLGVASNSFSDEIDQTGQGGRHRARFDMLRDGFSGLLGSDNDDDDEEEEEEDDDEEEEDRDDVDVGKDNLNMNITTSGLGASTVTSSTALPNGTAINPCYPHILPIGRHEPYHQRGYPGADSNSGSSDKRKGRGNRGAAYRAQHPFKAPRVSLRHMVGASSTIDRNGLALGRLSIGFLADPYKNMMVLLQEGIDREAYIVFRYGLIMMEHLFGGTGGDKKVASGSPAVVVPVSQVVPGFLQLLVAECEQRKLLGCADTPLSAEDFPPPRGGGTAAKGAAEARPSSVSVAAAKMPVPFPRNVVELPGRLPSGSPLLSPLMRHMALDGGPDGQQQSTQGLCAAIGSLRELMLRAMGWLEWSRDSASKAEDEVGAEAKKGGPENFPTSVPPSFPVRERPHRQDDGTSHVTSDDGNTATPPSLKLRRGDPQLYFIEGDGIGLSSLQEAIERRVAVLVFLEHFEEASKLLAFYASFHPLYPNIALELSAAGTELSVPHAASHPQRSGYGLKGELSSVRSRTMGCTYWLSLALYFLDTFVRPARASGEVPPSRAARPGEEGHAATTPHAMANDGKSALHGARQPDRLRYYFQILVLYPRLPLSDALALGVLVLLPPKYTNADIDLTIQALRILVDQQYDHRPQYPTGTANGVVHASTAPIDEFLEDYPSRCSFLLTATVEEVTPESVALQRYVDETADVQGPLCYIIAFGETRGMTYHIWREAYRARLNAGGYGFKRCEYDLNTIKMLTARSEAARCDDNDGLFPVSSESRLKLPLGLPGIAGLAKLPTPESALGCMMKQTFGTLRPSTAQVGRLQAYQPSQQGGDPRREVELRCNCGQPMHTTARSTGPVTQTAQFRKQPMPCGNSDCTQGQTPMCVVCGERMEPRMTELPPERSFVWCTVCLHGGHWCDMQAWFAKHTKCPVENCPCNCCDGKTL